MRRLVLLIALAVVILVAAAYLRTSPKSEECPDGGRWNYDAQLCE